jgi:L-2-hydroxyglutarate oxidase LhgO
MCDTLSLHDALPICTQLSDAALSSAIVRAYFNVIVSDDDRAIDTLHGVYNEHEAYTGKGTEIDIDGTPVQGIEGRDVMIPGEMIGAGAIINAAGLHADRVAEEAGLELHYSFQPFKGKYWKHHDPEFRMRRLVYPVPDLHLPFLGVHTAHNEAGEVFFGPSSTPILGRENYRGLQGLQWGDGLRLGMGLCAKLFRNTNGLRTLAWREAKLLTKSGVAAELAGLIRGVRSTDFSESLAKVGIRSQIFDPKAQRLVNDFVVIERDGVVHILNAISPAFTASFAFARHVIDHYLTTRE